MVLPARKLDDAVKNAFQHVFAAGGHSRSKVRLNSLLSVETMEWVTSLERGDRTELLQFEIFQTLVQCFWMRRQDMGERL